MAFANYNARKASPADANDQRPELAPLNMELVPNVLCQSFGIPAIPHMHEAYWNPAPLYGYGGYGQQGYQAQYLEQMQHAGGMSFGCMPCDLQQGFPQARMYPYHPHPAFAQLPRQLQYAPHDMYPAAHFRRSDAGHDMGLPTNSAPGPGYPEQRTQAAPANEACHRGVKRSADKANSLSSELGAAPSGQAHLVATALKKTRLVWTAELHQRFEEAVMLAGGIEVAVPKTVLEFMNVDGLTRDNVASHLQKHRMHLKKYKADSKPSRAHSKPYAQPDPACTQSVRTGETSARQDRSAPSSPAVGEGEAMTVPAFPADAVDVADKSHGNANFTTADDALNRGQGESSGDGTSGSGSGNSSSRHLATVAPPHVQVQGPRRAAGDAPPASHVLASFTAGYSNGNSNNDKTSDGARSSQTHDPLHRAHTSHVRQTRRSQMRETNPVDDSNGTCGQSACNRVDP